MKKLFLLLCMMVVVMRPASSQNFEGTVHWTMKMDVTDPKLKAEMDQAQQKMNDPATQAQMKEMQAKMNDPEFKKMMEANPQMKTQMEATMKMMQGGDVNSMMPTGMTLKVKGGNIATIVEGGMAGGMEVLHLKDKPPVRVDRTNKTYSTMPMGGGPAGGNTPPPKISKTNETMKILGYNCTKYTAEVNDRGTTVTQIFWTTTDIKDMDMKALAKQRAGQGGQPLFYEGIEGVPLKMEVGSPQGKVVMECTEIKKQSLSDSDFQVPADFKEVKMGRPGG